MFGLSQLFIKTNPTGKVVRLVAKVTNDFLTGGHKAEIDSFTEGIKRRFDVGKSVIDESFYFYGCEIHQETYGNITMSMKR